MVLSDVTSSKCNQHSNRAVNDLGEQHTTISFPKEVLCQEAISCCPHVMDLDVKNWHCRVLKTTVGHKGHNKYKNAGNEREEIKYNTGGDLCEMPQNSQLSRTGEEETVGRSSGGSPESHRTQCIIYGW